MGKFAAVPKIAKALTHPKNRALVGVALAVIVEFASKAPYLGVAHARSAPRESNARLGSTKGAIDPNRSIGLEQTGRSLSLLCNQIA